MRIIKQGEKGRRQTLVNGDISTVHHVTLNKPTDQHYQLTWNFDFKDVSKKQLIELSTKYLVIQMRPPFKVASNPTDKDWDNVTFDVKEYFQKSRKKLTPLEQGERLKASMTPEERKELAELLLAGVEDSES